MSNISRQTWQECVTWLTASTTPVANTTTETIIVPNVTIPSNMLQDGRILRLTVYGTYATTGSPTVTVRLRWGGVAGTVLAANGGPATGSGIPTGTLWKLDADIQTRVNGSTGTLFTMGTVGLGGTTAAASMTYTPLAGTSGLNPAGSTVDLTADTALSLTWQWGTASASNTALATNYVLEILN